MWSTKKINIKITIMSDDPVFMRLLQEMADEIRMLREDMARFERKMEGKQAKSRYLTMTEACDYVRKSRSTMQKWIAEGKIDFAVKNGGTYLFPEEKLRAYAQGMA